MALLKQAIRVLALGLLSSGSAFAAPLRDIELKAVFLFNFVQFATWPDGAFESETSPIVIAVLGEDPFGRVLDDAVGGERREGRMLEVRRYRRADEIRQCHLLFVASSEAGRAAEILAALQGRPILTVGESENFLQAGGAVRFVTTPSRVRFQVNLAATRAAGVTLSSKLLRAADTVRQ